MKEERDQARAEREEAQATTGRLEARVKELEQQLEEAHRAGRRQAGPFSRNKPKESPAKPGRKPGQAYGQKARRMPPDPERVDERVRVPLPDACPGCGGGVAFGTVRPHWQLEVVKILTRTRQYDVELGECTGCGRPVRGRHRDQTSGALGACGARKLGSGP